MGQPQSAPAQPPPSILGTAANLRRPHSRDAASGALEIALPIGFIMVEFSVKVDVKINVAQCIHAVAALLYALHHFLS